jgi:nitroreductase
LRYRLATPAEAGINPAMNSDSISVFEAVASRFSCRAFLPDPVSQATVRDILARAARAPSGGNLQAWRVDCLAGPRLAALVGDVAARIATIPRGETMDYRVYPEAMPAECEARRVRVGEQLYESIAVPRSDKAGRLAQYRRNFALFGAPVGLFVSLDRRLGPPQWADCGMFLQSIALVARGHGLHTCMQESWAQWSKTVARHVGLPATHIFFCAVALGRADEQAPINRWRSERAAPEHFATFAGF